MHFPTVKNNDFNKIMNPVKAKEEWDQSDLQLLNYAQNNDQKLS
jgi:hypothetical protein